MNEKKKTLLVLLPGHPDRAEWVMAWTTLLMHLCTRFHVEIRGSASNNIYLTRHVLAIEGIDE